MRKLCLLTLLLLPPGVPARAQGPPKQEPPELNQIKTVTLSPSYSCRQPEEFKKGYEQTALFLTEFGRKLNSTDLLFDGACRGEDSFRPATHGGNYSAIADLGGGLNVENVAPIDSAAITIDLSGLVPTEPGEPRFLDTAPVKVGHTYAVLINKRDVRGLFVFTVMEHVPTQRVVLRYVVREYKIAPPPGRHAAGLTDQKPKS